MLACFAFFDGLRNTLPQPHQSYIVSLVCVTVRLVPRHRDLASYVRTQIVKAAIFRLNSYLRL